MRSITPRRQAYRDVYWSALRERMRHYLCVYGYGSAKVMALYVGIAPSQVHRYTCPECEHDAEPSFSTGRAIERFLDTVANDPVAITTLQSKLSNHRVKKVFDKLHTPIL